MSNVSYAKLEIPKRFITRELIGPLAENAWPLTPKQLGEEITALPDNAIYTSEADIDCEHSAEHHYEELENLLKRKQIPFDSHAEDAYDDDHWHNHRRSRYYRPASACGRKEQDLSPVVEEDYSEVIDIETIQDIAALGDAKLIKKELLSLLTGFPLACSRTGPTADMCPVIKRGGKTKEGKKPSCQ